MQHRRDYELEATTWGGEPCKCVTPCPFSRVFVGIGSTNCKRCLFNEKTHKEYFATTGYVICNHD